KIGSVSIPTPVVSRRATPPARGTVHRSPAYPNAIRSLLSAGCWKMCGLAAARALAAPEIHSVATRKTTRQADRDRGNLRIGAPRDFRPRKYRHKRDRFRTAGLPQHLTVPACLVSQRVTSRRLAAAAAFAAPR